MSEKGSGQRSAISGQQLGCKMGGTRIRLLLGIIFLLLSACVPDVVKYNEAGNEHFDDAAYDDAISAYRQAQVAEPDMPEPYYNAANTYNRQGQVDGAQAQMEQALKTADDRLAAQAWYNLGNAYFDAQQWSQSAEAYKEALRLKPDDADAKHNLELALRNLQEEQQQAQQQQQNQDSESQESENQESEGQESENQEQQDGEGAQETPAPQSESANAEEQEQQEQAKAQSQEGQPMTPEQAMQLLQALLGNSETLQERLREIYQVPGPQPEEDW